MIDYGGAKQRVAKFDAKHGENVDIDGWILFEDGARRELHPLGALIEPSSNPNDLAKAIFHYWSVKLKRAVNEFEQRKRHYKNSSKVALNMAFAGSAPDPDVVEAELTALRDAVRRIQEKYEEAKNDVDRTTPSRIKELNERAAQNRERHQAILSRLSTLEV